MKEKKVVFAVIKKDNKILSMVRGHGEYKGYYEFPGGKIEENETNEEALKREIKEELNASIEVLKLIDIIEYDYPNFHLKMYAYLCELTSSFTLNEHLSYVWQDINELDNLNWLKADLSLINKIKENF